MYDRFCRLCYNKDRGSVCSSPTLTTSSLCNGDSPPPCVQRETKTFVRKGGTADQLAGLGGHLLRPLCRSTATLADTSSLCLQASRARRCICTIQQMRRTRFLGRGRTTAICSFLDQDVPLARISSWQCRQLLSLVASDQLVLPINTCAM